MRCRKINVLKQKVIYRVCKPLTMPMNLKLPIVQVDISKTDKKILDKTKEFYTIYRNGKHSVQFYI